MGIDFLRRSHATPDFFLKWTVIALMVFVQWYTFGSGLLITDDSRHYIRASLSFRENFSFMHNDGGHFLFWPPLFPMILALIGINNGLILMNIVVSIGIALLVFKLSGRVIQSAFFRALCCINVLVGVHLLLISTFLWSELIFLLLALALIDQLSQAPASERAFLWSIVIGFLLCLQRNAGWFILTGAVVWLFLQRKEWRHQPKKIFAIFVAYSGGFAWNSYVWFIRDEPTFTFSERFFQYANENFKVIIRDVMNAYVPIRIFDLSLPVVIVLFIVFVGVGYFLWRSENNSMVTLLSLISAVYLTAMCVVLVVNIAAFPVVDEESDRFISPIIPLLSILVFRQLEIFYQKQKRPRKQFLLALILSGMLYPLARTFGNMTRWHHWSKWNIEKR